MKKKYPIIAMTLLSAMISVSFAPAGSESGSAQGTCSMAADSLDRKINDLLDRMTLDEMIGQLNLRPCYDSNMDEIRAGLKDGSIGAILKANGAAHNLELQKIAVDSSRLGIPVMFQEDVIHGYRTILPIPLALSCTWNDDLVEEGAGVAAAEAYASGIRLTYAPMVDISDDPRWGRIMETLGEDPYLSSRMAVAQIKGFQGGDFSQEGKIASCIKHFAGYASLSAGRDYHGNYFSDRQLKEVYLKPYEAAVREGVASFMCSYTMFEGVPATNSWYLNTEILRNYLGFNGLLMTDWSTLSHVVAQGAAPDYETSAERGMNAGIEMDMTSRCYLRNLKHLVETGRVNSSAVRAAAYHALKIKFQAGLFDHPYAGLDEKKESEVILSKYNLSVAEEAAAQSMVLLKNDSVAVALPLTSGSIAVVGPFAEAKDALMGKWTCKGDSTDVQTVADALSERFGSVRSVPCGFGNIDKAYMKKAAAAARKSSAAVVCLGEPTSVIGEGSSTSRIAVSDEQIELLKAVRKVSRKVIVVLFNGRPLVTEDILENCDALLEAWYPGTRGAAAVASILSGDRNPSGRLTQTFPRTVGQVPIRYNELKTFYDVDFSDLEKGPQFPFGYGLSYTDWTYSGLKATKTVLPEGRNISISVNVTNSGNMAGRETVQLYVAYQYLDVIPREKELKGYTQVVLNPGETQTVSFSFSRDAFRYVGPNGENKLAKGPVRILAGHDSEHLQEVKITLE